MGFSGCRRHSFHCFCVNEMFASPKNHKTVVACNWNHLSLNFRGTRRLIHVNHNPVVNLLSDSTNEQILCFSHRGSECDPVLTTLWQTIPQTMQFHEQFNSCCSSLKIAIIYIFSWNNNFPNFLLPLVIKN